MHETILRFPWGANSRPRCETSDGSRRQSSVQTSRRRMGHRGSWQSPIGVHDALRRCEKELNLFVMDDLKPTTNHDGIHPWTLRIRWGWGFESRLRNLTHSINKLCTLANFIFVTYVPTDKYKEIGTCLRLFKVSFLTLQYIKHKINNIIRYVYLYLLRF